MVGGTWSSSVSRLGLNLIKAVVTHYPCLSSSFLSAVLNPVLCTERQLVYNCVDKLDILLLRFGYLLNNSQFSNFLHRVLDQGAIGWEGFRIKFWDRVSHKGSLEPLECSVVTITGLGWLSTSWLCSYLSICFIFARFSFCWFLAFVLFCFLLRWELTV